MSTEPSSELANANSSSAGSNAGNGAESEERNVGMLVLAALVFAAAHVWALMTLWDHVPSGRRLLLVLVYGGLLVGSSLLTKRLPPPLLPSLIPFGVVLVWFLFFVRG